MPLEQFYRYDGQETLDIRSPTAVNRIEGKLHCHGRDLGVSLYSTGSTQAPFDAVECSYLE